MYKVLLVEDELRIRNGLKRLIEEVIGGFQIVQEASNGWDALEWLKEILPDLLITDIRMKEMNGIDMIKRVREQYPEMLIIIISGYGDFQYAREGLRYGVKEYLLKPVEQAELTRALEKMKFLLDVRRNHENRLDTKPLDVEKESERHIIRRVKELIMLRLDQDISLQYLADQVHLNHRYLSVLFKQETGQNLSDYVKVCRMNKAKQLLQDTNLKILDVAKLSGYANYKYFMSVFKQTLGVTPTEYRDGQERR